MFAECFCSRIKIWDSLTGKCLYAIFSPHNAPQKTNLFHRYIIWQTAPVLDLGLWSAIPWLWCSLSLMFMTDISVTGLQQWPSYTDIFLWVRNGLAKQRKRRVPDGLMRRMTGQGWRETARAHTEWELSMTREGKSREKWLADNWKGWMALWI